MQLVLVLFSVNICITCHGMQSEMPQLVHKKRSRSSLYLDIPLSIHKKTYFAQLGARLEQDDYFSCGYRTLFHAHCFEEALAKAMERSMPLEEFLDNFLKNEQTLHDLTSQMLTYIQDKYPKHDLSKGIASNHLMNFVRKRLPKLKSKIKHISLKKKDDIYSLEWKETGQNIHDSKRFHDYLTSLEKPYHSCHFACFLPSDTNHWALASIITNMNNAAKLYFIDSNNNQLCDKPDMKFVVEQLLVYVEKINQNNNNYMKLKKN